MGKAVAVVLLALMGMAVSAMAEQKRELIGKVYEKPIYRDELDTNEKGLRGEYLRYLILPSLMEQLRERHKLEIEPTRQELAATEKYFSGLGVGQAGDIASWFLKQWKAQRYLYIHYGGGRILWQQAGLEAFDATLKWLKEEERAGHFFMRDAALRDDFYFYWIGMNHGSFLIDDRVRIKEEFLAPEWAPASHQSSVGN